MKKINPLILPIAVITSLIIVGAVLAIVLRPYGESTKSADMSKSASLKIDVETIEWEIQDIGKLCTAEYDFTAVETIENSKIKVWVISIPWSSSKAIIQYSGTIAAGIDFENAAIEADAESKTLNVALPKAEILNKQLDYDSFKWLDEKNGLFNKLDLEDANDAAKELLSKEAEEATEKGLLTDAQYNAEKIIHTMYDGLCDKVGYSIVITFA